jgi:hypothetical protein
MVIANSTAGMTREGEKMKVIGNYYIFCIVLRAKIKNQEE